MSLVTAFPDGKIQIDQKGAFCELLKTYPASTAFSEALKHIGDGISAANPAVTGGALNTVRGAWYEWLLATSAWNWHCEHKSLLAVLLPNTSQFDIADLYQAKERGFIHDLRQKLADHTSVKLVTSNPDFVIVDTAKFALQFPLAGAISTYSEQALEGLDALYESLIGQCSFETLVGFISVKTSLRPDRRLQISHEGSLMKALYAHLQTRDWVINPRGLRYYAIASALNDADRDGLRTVATHSITTVNDTPKAAVDEVFAVNSEADAKIAWELILGA